MTFAGTDRAYDRFMGRFSQRLAPLFADFAGVTAGLDVVDVGCGPGALTGELVARLGEAHVAAVDPTEGFVAACRGRFPGVEVEQAPAEVLPFPDGRFGVALAQLVVSFMNDADAGLRELHRVTRAGGTVAICMWLGEPAMELLTAVNASARAVAPGHPAVNGPRRFRTEEEGVELLRRTGLEDVRTTTLTVTAGYDDFDDLESSVLAGSGPLAPLLESLDETGLERFRATLREQVGDPAGPFDLTGRAWVARGRVGA